VVRFAGILALCVAGLLSAPAKADVTVAVASNFLTPVREIAALFEAREGAHVRLVHGSTGLLFAQITHGAPFEVFLAADQHRPELLEADDRALARASYAEGILILVSRDDLPDDRADYAGIMRDRRVALANPRLAPYGVAAMDGLNSLGLDESSVQLVMGDNVGQAANIFVSGNADFGLLSASQLIDLHKIDGSINAVEFQTGTRILQDMVLLAGASPEAVEFFDFMASDAAQEVILRMGYRIPQ